MEKEYILGEIKRTARQNDGIPLGFRTFESETGIKRTDWLGKFWTRWNEAVQEAGFTPNRLKPATPSHELLEKYALFVQGLCRIPAISDHRFKEHRDPELPEHSTFSRILGPKAKLVEQLLEYCRSKDGFLDVVKICEDFTRV